MNKICTSLEQSQKLIELGIDIKTADMDYIPFANNPQEYDCIINVWNNEHEKDWIPAWSLSALLGILTEQDFIIKTVGNEFNIDIPIRHCKIWFSSLLDAAFEMVCWLLENKNI